MNAENWRSLLGSDGWKYVRGPLMQTPVANPDDDDTLAAILDRLVELGFTVPAAAQWGPVQISDGATRVQWPGDAAALTAAGLLAHWQAHGHGWAVFHLPTLLRAVRGPGLAWLTGMWALYEDEAIRAGLTLEQLVPGRWRAFVGGDRDGPAAQSAAGVQLAADLPGPTVERGQAG
jgi:hypothetical protein